MARIYYAYDANLEIEGKHYLARELAQDQADIWTDLDITDNRVPQNTVKSVDVDRLKDQSIITLGAQIFYQFNSKSMGRRTFVRDIDKFIRINDEEWRGIVTILGNKYIVRCKNALMANWYIVGPAE